MRGVPAELLIYPDETTGTETTERCTVATDFLRMAGSMAETKRNGTEIKAVLSTNKGSVRQGQSFIC